MKHQITDFTVSITGWSQSQLHLLLVGFLLEYKKKMKLYIEFDIYGTKFCNWIIMFVSRFGGYFLISVAKFFFFSVMIFALFSSFNI